MQQYDAVVIGAGNAGLTAAAKLAKKGVGVLLLERHNIPGGCATSFCRGRFEFETALHQLSGVGTPDNPGQLWRLFEGLDVFDKVDFIVEEDLYRTVVPGKMDITLKADKQAIIDELKRQFPKEAANIDRFFEFLYAFFMEVVSVFFMKDPNPSREKYPRAFQCLLKPTQEVLDDFFEDEWLMRVLTTYWGYLGLPPSTMPFVDWAMMLLVYTEYKPQHIKGCSQALSNALADTVLTNGGEIRYNCTVEKILVEDGKVKGVRTAQGEEFGARHVISNASKITTYVDMIGAELLPEETFEEMRGCTIGASAVTAYLGLDKTPEELGITTATTFVSPGAHADREYEATKHLGICPDDGICMTCYTKIDPSFSPPGTTLMAIISLQYMEPWLQVPPAQYHEEKYKAARALLDLAEKVYPGLSDHIEEMEISTPITHARYLGHPGGAFYGFDQYVKDSASFISPKSPVEGLILAGAWATSGGFQPTLDSGARAARLVLKSMNS